jgi:hypothetical protein
MGADFGAEADPVVAARPNQRPKLTGAAVQVFRTSSSLQVAPAV